MVTSDERSALSASDEPTLSDSTLLRRFQEGEADAATAIYLRYAKRLQRLAESQTGGELAVRLDPEDVVQSVFRTFFRHAAEGHYEIPDGEELWKLFLVIALNKIRTLGHYHRAACLGAADPTAPPPPPASRQPLHPWARAASPP